MSSAPGGMDVKAFFEELKSNRKTQVASGVFLLVLGFMGYSIFVPDQPKKKTARAANSGPGTAATTLDPRQSKALQSLPDLARLGKAGELPDEEKMRRDLFLFDGPPKPYVAPPPPPPPPPPTPEEIAAQIEQAKRDLENSTRPNSIRYIGYIASKSAGQLAAFMKGEEPLTMKVGELANPSWKLVQITDKAAIFQNLKFADMRHSLEAKDGGGGAAGSMGSQNVSNDF